MSLVPAIASTADIPHRLKKRENYGIVRDMKVGELRKKYPVFVYKRYAYRLKGNDLVMWFAFEVGEIKFRPVVTIKNVSATNVQRVGDSAMQNLAFHVGLAEMPSYWKATASPKIVVEARYLNKTQLNWWHDLFIKGMGQYFFENNIDFRARKFLTIITKYPNSGGHANYATLNNRKMASKILLPVGGGKDAAVTYEILKAARQNIKPFELNPTNAQKALLRKMKEGSPIVVQRIIDPKLLELNRKGYVNGHTPFSAYLAFLTTLCATLFDYKYIALSNERSSEQGNVQYLSTEINHQYSKTFEFEKKFRAYSKKYLTANIEYFSFLRPLYELQIARQFAKYPQYFSAFLSCNEAHKTHSGTTKATEKWCGACSKCLFVFAALYPFLEIKQLVKIFGKNLFEDAKLIALMEELVGDKRFKPFECVGTTQESLAAFYLALRKTHAPLPPLLQYFRRHIAKKHPTVHEQSKTILASWNKKHALPPHLEKALKSMI